MKDYFIRSITHKRGKQYYHEYRDKQGKRLTKQEYLPYIKHIYIAPAYDQVKINKSKRDKILAIGVDDRGRKQYT